MDTKVKARVIALGVLAVLNLSGMSVQQANARCKSPFGYGSHLSSDVEELDEGQLGNLVSMDGQVHPIPGPPISFPGPRAYSDGSGENHDDCAMGTGPRKQGDKQSLLKNYSARTSGGNPK
jgi:hypothetical protein